MLLLLATPLVACESSSSGGAATDPCTTLQGELMTCGLLSSGEFRCQDDCSSRCAVGLECGDLSLVFCGDPDSAPDFKSCYDDCTTFTCASGETIEASWECDGFEDCADGSDELTCPGQTADFRCDQAVPGGNGGVASGSTCSQAKQKLKGCGFLGTYDTWNDCNPPDTPAETCFMQCSMAASCADLGILICNTPDTPSESFVSCVNECESLPDDDPAVTVVEEAFTCADGEVIASEWVCDGLEDCPDGSDEIDCATFVCI